MSSSSSHSSTVTLKGFGGAEYIGLVTSGSNTGTFTFTHANGTAVYVGEYSNGMFNGKGRRSCYDGSSWECEWRNGEGHGLCVVTYPKGGRELKKFNNGLCMKNISEGV